MPNGEIHVSGSTFQDVRSDGLSRVAAWWQSQVGFRLLLAASLPGLPFVAARMLLHQHSGIFNLDFLLITLLEAAGFRKVASVFFVVIYLLESVRLLDAVYFFSEQDLTFAAHFLSEVAHWLVVAWLLLFLAVCFVSLRIWQAITPETYPARLVQNALPLLLLVFVAAVVDMHEGFNPFLVLPHGKPRPHMIGEVLIRMPIELSRAAGHDADSTVLLHSATDSLWDRSQAQARRDNVVVVMVESMGLLLDTSARKKEFSSILEDPGLLRRYSLEEGTVPFTGSTVVGEMRELCHLQTGVHIQSSTLAGKQPCLPQQFRSLGFQATSFHGYRETMFSRSTWYPMLGFQQTYFTDRMGYLPQCGGAFYGVCDSAIAAELEHRLVRQKRTDGPLQFLYWMTLNSHLPIDVSASPTQACPVASDATVCGQLGLVEVVLDSVRKLALDPDIGPTTIVIVGDHAPPYADYKRRDLFDQHSVPFLVLQPRR